MPAGASTAVTAKEVGMDVAVFTRTGVERIQRFALELARTRSAKHLTLVTKSNAQRHGHGHVG